MPRRIPKSSARVDEHARRRVIIEGVTPEINGGRFHAKRVVGEEVIVEADIFSDGHDAIVAVLRWKHDGDKKWNESEFAPLGNDRWRAAFTVTRLGCYRYTIEAWVDVLGTWTRDLRKKVAAGQDVATDLAIGAQIVKGMTPGARGKRRDSLDALVAHLESAAVAVDDKVESATSSETAALASAHADRRLATRYGRELGVMVDPVLARFSAWYELFPRSAAMEPGRHGTFRDCEARLSEIAEMGFDVLYLPPIHPIGTTKRKGRNGKPVAQPGDSGSPWAIGAADGGHKAIHSELGTPEDFRRLVARARERGIEVALDIAFQCSPDHPYVREHPEWFRWRPDGAVQFAENPPKKYEDIYPLNFDSEQWFELWEELKSVFVFWIEQGVRIFRVDNPHTKPLHFWEWLLADVRSAHPDVIFLSEAFTRPRVMEYLAKIGFNQSYTYFAWRNTRREIEQYMTELTQTQVKEYFRPNFWPNTPDILTEFLQTGGRAAFMIRAVLAATLSSSYGIYGPAFELGEHVPREPGSEEYLNSEKYEIKSWNRDDPASLRLFLARINRIRREHAALQSNGTIRFHPVDNEQLVCYSKRAPGTGEALLMVVNLDPHYVQSGWVDVRLDELGIDAAHPYEVQDLVGDGRYVWKGSRNYVELSPRAVPAHVFLVKQHLPAVPGDGISDRGVSGGGKKEEKLSRR